MLKQNKVVKFALYKHDVNKTANKHYFSQNKC